MASKFGIMASSELESNAGYNTNNKVIHKNYNNQVKINYKNNENNMNYAKNKKCKNNSVNFNNSHNTSINVNNNYYNINITTNNNVCNINYTNNTFSNETNAVKIEKKTGIKTDSKSEKNNIISNETANTASGNCTNHITSGCGWLRARVVKDLQKQNIPIPKEFLTSSLESCQCCPNHQCPINNCNILSQPFEDIKSQDGNLHRKETIGQNSQTPNTIPQSYCSQHDKKTRSKVFGVEISKLPTTLSGGLVIPRILHEMFSILSTESSLKGIFRLCASKIRMRALQECIDSTGVVPEDCLAVDLACILKQFFRSLPVPLITRPLLLLLISIHHLQCSSERRLCLLLEACLLLPSLHLSTLKALLRLLKGVADLQDINQMTATNLAVCFIPNLISMDNVELMEGRTFKNEVEVLVCLMNNHQHLGSIQFFPNLLSQPSNRNFSPLLSNEEGKRKSSEASEKFATNKNNRTINHTNNFDEKENTFSTVNQSLFSKTLNNDHFKHKNDNKFRKSKISSLFKKVHKQKKANANTTILNDKIRNNNHVSSSASTNNNASLFNNTQDTSDFFNKSVNYNIDQNNNNNTLNHTTPANLSSGNKRKLQELNVNSTVHSSKRMRFLNVFSSQRKRTHKKKNMSNTLNNASLFDGKIKESAIKKFFNKIRTKKEKNTTKTDTTVDTKEDFDDENNDTFHHSVYSHYLNNTCNLVEKRKHSGANNVLDKYTLNYGQHNNHNYSFDFIRKNKNVLKSKKYKNNNNQVKSNNNTLKNISITSVGDNKVVKGVANYKENNNCHSKNKNKNIVNNSNYQDISNGYTYPKQKAMDALTGHVCKIDFDEIHSMDEMGGFDDEPQCDVRNNYFSDDNFYHGRNGDDDDDNDYVDEGRSVGLIWGAGTFNNQAGNNKDYDDGGDGDDENDGGYNILDKGMIMNEEDLPTLDEEYYDDTDEDEEEETNNRPNINNTTICNEDDIKITNNSTTTIIKNTCNIKTFSDTQCAIFDENAFEVSNLSQNLSQGDYCKARNAEICFHGDNISRNENSPKNKQSINQELSLHLNISQLPLPSRELQTPSNNHDQHHYITNSMDSGLDVMDCPNGR